MPIDPRRPARHRWNRALPFVAVWMTVALQSGTAAPAPGPTGPAVAPDGEHQAQILILSVDDMTRPWVQHLVEGFRDVALSQPHQPALYFESLDATRFGDPDYLESLRQWLERKYRAHGLDLVVPLGEDAIAFLAEHDGEPWRGTPLLYVESGPVRVDVERRLPHAAGLDLEDVFPASLDVVKQILPDTERVALMYGASEVEQRRFAGFADKIRQAGLQPIDIAGLTLEDTQASVAHLPARTVLYILAPYVDGSGRALSSARACAAISAAANRPSFSLPEHDLGCGVVGGRVRDFARIGQLLGAEAMRALAAPPARSTRVPLASFTTLAFDARQLERFGIPESRLPAGSAIRFQRPNIWRDHRALVLAAAAIAAVQAILIGALLFEHRRRRRAEVAARQHLGTMAHLDRRAAMGELTTSLAHELNQPLNAILQNAGAAELMLASRPDDPDLDEFRAILADIRSDDIRASETIRRMRALLRKQELETRPLDPNEVARDAVALVAQDARERQVRVDAELAATIAPVLGDRVHLQQVLLNLILNGMEAMVGVPPERRQLVVRTAQHNGTIEMSVRDSGCGIAGRDPARVFEPFFTTKPEGMGMGLSISRSIVEAHAGWITAENNPDGGATLRMHLPAVKGHHESRPGVGA